MLIGATLGVAAMLAASAPANAAVTASFSGGVLTVFGDGTNNTITVSRNAAGKILVNGGAVAVAGGTPTVANTALIQVFGQGGNDTITPQRGQRRAAAGQPVRRRRQRHPDRRLGRRPCSSARPATTPCSARAASTSSSAAAENDTLTGGDADDQVFGESGNDRMIWNPGDDTDLNEGGAGTDTVEVNGGNGAEEFTATANGTRVRFDRLDPAPFSIDIGTTENLVLNANGGDDSFSATGNLAALIQITVDGGTGNDTILGSNGIDTPARRRRQRLRRRPAGQRHGASSAPATTSSSGIRATAATPSKARTAPTRCCSTAAPSDEIFDASANGGRVRFTRNLGNIVMDLNDVEVVDLNALGGADTLTVNDLTGTDVVEVNVNLAGTLGGTAGDAAADTVIVNGTNGDDIIDVFGAGHVASPWSGWRRR